MIERSDDPPAPAEAEQRKEAIREAQLKELENWASFAAMPTRPRRRANDLMDAKWADKRKRAQAAYGTRARITRRRPPVKGSKDKREDSFKTFTATSARRGHTIVNILAA